MESVNVRLKDVRYMSDEKLTQKDVARMLNVPASSIAEYEKEGYYVPSNILIKYCQTFNVSADYLLGLTNNLKQPNFGIHELGLSDAALDKLRNRKIYPELLSEIIEHEKFDDMMLDAAVYVDGFADESVQRYNTLMQVGRAKLKHSNLKSLDAKKDLLALDYVQMNQDYLFSGRMGEALKNILHDIKFRHKDDSSTSDYQNGESDFKNLIASTADILEKKDKKVTLGQVVRTMFLNMLHIKNSDSNLDRVAKIGVDEDFDNLVNQSPIVEPDDRKRRRKK
ncbi:helix-turn-helix domain-containing protein [Butyrivibrio sp. NC3005]|uniref:helix-turn-helix domain-containing protein n=1 Tax=Butyrivibrio sp. NC3005 TaxID=1280685 RepID=UPI0004083B57|nr:helix-turn-helix transcriptional regulator [Butyrivibrio sp. NC3005]